MAPLYLTKLIQISKLRINVKNKMTLIGAKFDADLINISEVTSRKTIWPRFLCAMQIYIARISDGNVASWVGGWVSVTAGTVSKRLNLS